MQDKREEGKGGGRKRRKIWDWTEKGIEKYGKVTEKIQINEERVEELLNKLKEKMGEVYTKENGLKGNEGKKIKGMVG